MRKGFLRRPFTRAALALSTANRHNPRKPTAFAVEPLEGRVLLTTDFALGKHTSASSYVGDLATYAPAKATDGNTTTRWASKSEANTHSWIYVDLGSTYDIDRVHLHWELAFASSYKVQTSANASTWTDIYSTQKQHAARQRPVDLRQRALRPRRLPGQHRQHALLAVRL
jgi:hypothetical protein